MGMKRLTFKSLIAHYKEQAEYWKPLKKNGRYVPGTGLDSVSKAYEKIAKKLEG